MEWTKEIPEITGTEWGVGRDRDRDEGMKERKERRNPVGEKVCTQKKYGVRWHGPHISWTDKMILKLLL